MNDDMWENRGDGQHPEILRKMGVIAPECYLADERQSYLVLLLQYVRPNNFICKPCKTRCLEALVKGASKDNVYWNTVPNVIYPGFPKPAEERLNVKLEQLGINASNSWGLDLPYTQLSRCFEPVASRITLHPRIWDHIAVAANYLVCQGSDCSPSPKETPLGDKLQFMCLSEFSIKDLVHNRSPEYLIFLIGRTLSQSTPNCECGLLAGLDGHHVDEISALDWPEFVLNVSRQFFGDVIPDYWDQSVSHNPEENPLCLRYPFPTASVPIPKDSRRTPKWIVQWQDKYAKIFGDRAIAEPSGMFRSTDQVEYTPSRAREDALHLYLLDDFRSCYNKFKASREYKFCQGLGKDMANKRGLKITAQQELVNKEFVESGGSELFITPIEGRKRAICVTDAQRMKTLRHRMNPPVRRYWECEDDGSNPMEFPDRWARLV